MNTMIQVLNALEDEYKNGNTDGEFVYKFYSPLLNKEIAVGIIAKEGGFESCFCCNSTAADEFFICIGEDLPILSDNCLRFLLAHEMGHHVHMNMNELKGIGRFLNNLKGYAMVFSRNFQAASGNIHQMEIEADAFAVGLIGKESVLDAITEIIKIVGSDNTCGKEFINRKRFVEKIGG